MEDRNIKATGIVIKANEYKDNDKMLSIFTREYGKIDVCAKGCKKPSSSLFAISGLFTYGNFQIYNKNERFTLMQGEIIHSFYDLSLDIEKFGVAQFMADISAMIAFDEQKALFSLFIYLLNYMEKDELTSRQALLIFCLKACDIFGVRPNLIGCGSCGKPADKFHIEHGGIFCSDCLEGGFRLSGEQIVFLCRILATKNSELIDLDLSNDSYLTKILVNYLLYHFELPKSYAKFLSKIGTL